MFDNFPQSEIDIVGPDGIVRHRTKGVVDTKSVVIPDVSIVINVGDEIRRRLPNGAEETFDVLDPAFHDKLHGIPSHYQVAVRKKGTFPRGTGGNYTVHVTGQNARVNIGSKDQSMNIVTHGDIFGSISAAVEAGVKDASQRQQLLSAVEEMKREQGRPGFAAAYQKFVSLAADHIGLVTPFLPALTQFLGG